MEGIPAFSWFIKKRWPQKIVSRVRWIWDILDANVHLTALLSEKKCKKISWNHFSQKKTSNKNIAEATENQQRVDF